MGTVSTKELLAALKAVKPGLDKQGTVEQMDHFIFTGDSVITYNDKICVSHPIDTDIRCSVNAEDLFNIVNKIKESEIDMEFEGNILSLETETTEAAIASDISEAKAEDMISILGIEDLDWEPLHDDVIKGIDLCRFSVARDRTKGVITCVGIKDNRVLSSDNIRVSMFEGDEDIEMPEILLPGPAANELVKFKPTHYCLTESWVHFLTEDEATFSSRVVTGQYPPAEKFFKIDTPNKLKLPDGLIDTVEGVTAMCVGESEAEKNVTVKIDDGMLVVQAKKERGWVTKKMEVPYKGDTILFGINPYFLSEVLRMTQHMLLGKNRAIFRSANFRHLISLPKV